MALDKCGAAQLRSLVCSAPARAAGVEAQGIIVLRGTGARRGEGQRACLCNLVITGMPLKLPGLTQCATCT
eukprot:scaffold5824_cov73-Phaeocystis_antarctica.AAC.1